MVQQQRVIRTQSHTYKAVLKQTETGIRRDVNTEIVI